MNTEFATTHSTVKTTALEKKLELPSVRKKVQKNSDKIEQEALVSIADELCQRICERLQSSSRNEFFAIKIKPEIGNFGAVAQIRVLSRDPAKDLASSPIQRKGPTLINEVEFKSKLLIPVIQEARAGKLPSLIPLRLVNEDELFVFTMTLFIGIKPKQKSQQWTQVLRLASSC